MKVLQIVFVFLLGLLSFPSATANIDDGRREDVLNHWVDVFSTLSCSCFDSRNAAGSEHHGDLYGSYFGISYYHREYDRLYNWTAIEVREPHRHHSHRPWHLQPKMIPKCVIYDDGTELCYWRYEQQAHARYTFEGYLRELPNSMRSKKHIQSALQECRTICPEVVKLPLASATSCHRVDYKMRMICFGHAYGECTYPYRK